MNEDVVIPQDIETLESMIIHKLTVGRAYAGDIDRYAQLAKSMASFTLAKAELVKQATEAQIMGVDLTETRQELWGTNPSKWWENTQFTGQLAAVAATLILAIAIWAVFA